jgi:hypothetical protein
MRINRVATNIFRKEDAFFAPEGYYVNRKPSLGKVRSAPEVRYKLQVSS